MNYSISIISINALDKVEPSDKDLPGELEARIEAAYGKELIQALMLDNEGQQQFVTLSPYFDAKSEEERYAMVSRMMKKAKANIVERERHKAKAPRIHTSG